MAAQKVDLSSYRSTGFNRGAGVLKESLWLIVSLFLFNLCPLSLSGFKCSILRLFGARVGRGVVIKPQVKITFPWKLSIGDHVWIGEQSWLLNLEHVEVGNNVCISQRAFLCTGSHDYKSTAFNLIVKPIKLEDGSWIGADAWVGPSVVVGSHAVLTAGSVTSKNLEPYGIYRGNPAVLVKQRIIS